MRRLRDASILPIVLVLAGCNASSEAIDTTTDESVFLAGGERADYLVAELALQNIAERPELERLQVQSTNVDRVFIDAAGEGHARVGQKIGGIPVFGAEAIVHLGRDGNLNSITDRFATDIDVDVRPSISEREALDIATLEMGGQHMLVGESQVDLQILRHEGQDHLAYRVRLDMRTVDDEPTKPVVFVDAHTRAIVWAYDNLQTLKARRTYSSNQNTFIPGDLVRTEGEGPIDDDNADEAHDNAGIVWDYYSQRHGRDSFDGAGATIKSTVHFGFRYNNAFWDGAHLVMGDGDADRYDSFTVLDIVGHEFTHAVTERSSNLIYANESGALNEAISDIFAVAIQLFQDEYIHSRTFWVGEECANYFYDIHRLDEPIWFNYYPTRYVGTDDNGGVHWNAEIVSLAFAMMVKGGTHPYGATNNVVTPLAPSSWVIGIEMAADIFYKANTQCLTPGSTFRDARGCTEAVANAEYGPAAAATVTQAWTAVGVPAPYNWTAYQSKANISGAATDKSYFTLVVPAGAKALRFTTMNGTGNANLYVRKDSKPTMLLYTCRSVYDSNVDSCTIDNPTVGATYHVMIHGASAFSGLTYKAEWGN